MRIGLWLGAGLTIAMLFGLSQRVKISGFDAFVTPSTSMEDIDVQDCAPPNEC